MRVLLCIIGGIALILAALCVPLRFSLSGAVESGGGRGCVAARYLFFCKRLVFDLYLLDPPQLTLVWHNGAERLSSHPLLGKKKKKRKSPMGHALMHALHLGEMRLTWVVGIRDDPAAAAAEPADLLSSPEAELTPEVFWLSGDMTLFPGPGRFPERARLRTSD